MKSVSAPNVKVLNSGRVLRNPLAPSARETALAHAKDARDAARYVASSFSVCVRASVSTRKRLRPCVSAVCNGS